MQLRLDFYCAFLEQRRGGCHAPAIIVTKVTTQENENHQAFLYSKFDETLESRIEVSVYFQANITKKNQQTDFAHAPYISVRICSKHFSTRVFFDNLPRMSRSREVDRFQRNCKRRKSSCLSLQFHSQNAFPFPGDNPFEPTS